METCLKRKGKDLHKKSLNKKL